MSADARASDFFVAGGTLRADTPSYVKRPEDDELLNLALAGEFCYVLTPRQMGKSSLMVQTARRLQERGVRTAIIDLTGIGTDINIEQWYLGLIARLRSQLRLRVDPEDWWAARDSLSVVQRFTDFLHDVVLVEIEGPVVIFIDEIDTTLNLGFSDNFFAAIRFAYNARASDPAYHRLTFVLLGVAAPADLIKDLNRTPFNIGHRVDLYEFSRESAEILQHGLEAIFPGQGKAIFARIFHWTNGHPYLTQKLCLAATEAGNGRWTDERVDGLVERLFLAKEARKEANLQFVRSKILDHPEACQLLALYRKVYRGEKITDDERSPVQNQLKLSGLVQAKSGYLSVRNEVYKRAFDLVWVRENTPVNWTLIAANAFGIAALLAVGLTIYNLVVFLQFRDCGERFLRARTSEERVTLLARAFRAHSLLIPTDYDYQAREWFYGLRREEQLNLFDAAHVEDSDLMVIIRGLHTTLADVDGTDSTGPLLEAMAKALDQLDETTEAIRLGEEIDSWREAREFFQQGLYSEARDAYTQAIALNGENPATLYERARVLMELSACQQALSDLDQVMAIAEGSVIPTSTPLPLSTTASAASPVLTSTRIPATPIGFPPSITSNMTPSPIPTEMPKSAAIPTPRPITSEFEDRVQIISAVRKLIASHPDCSSHLALAPSSDFPNLREIIPAQARPAEIAVPLPEGCQYTQNYALDVNSDGNEEGIIMCYFDQASPPGAQQHGSPIAAYVYHLDDSTPPSILTYELRVPGDDYLCECRCVPTMNDALSELPGPELVMGDTCDGERMRLTIFQWDQTKPAYLPVGHFHGHYVSITLDTVIVEELQETRAQLAIRQTYHPTDGQTYYLDDQGTLVAPAEQEIVFSHEEPEDVTLSPYPEKVVLAFYNHYADTIKTSMYFAEGAWEGLSHCDTSLCGCAAPRSEIAHVQVTSLRFIEAPSLGPNQARVEATVVCEHLDGTSEGELVVGWHLIHTADRWQLDSVE